MAKQKFDWGFTLFLTIQLLGSVGYLIHGGVFETPHLLFMVFAMGVSIALLIWVCLSHEYNFTDSSLVFRAGPFRKTVALIDIFEIMPTHDGIPESRGAVRIRYLMSGIAGDSFMMIPKNQDEFLAEIAVRCPHLEPYVSGFKRAAPSVGIILNRDQRRASKQSGASNESLESCTPSQIRSICESPQSVNHSNDGRIEGQKDGDRNIQNSCAKSVFFCPHFSVQPVLVVKSFIRVIRVIRGFPSFVPAEGRAGSSVQSVEPLCGLRYFIQFFAELATCDP